MQTDKSKKNNKNLIKNLIELMIKQWLHMQVLSSFAQIKKRTVML